jgi:NitT/TauT family transport system substrate-binding protein
MIARRIFLGTAAVAAAAALGTSIRAQGLTPLKIAANPVETFAEPYYAEELGLFAKAGLAVELSRVTSGAAALQGVTTGAVDIGTSSIVQMANAYLNGVRLTYFAGSAYIDAATQTSTGLCVAKDSPIRSARDLEGKIISVASIRDGTHLMAAAYLQRNGIDLAKVNFVELPFPAQAAALVRGQIGAAVCVEPFMPGENDDLRLLATSVETIGPRFAAAGWLSTPKWIRDNRSIARRYAAVMYETARWANDKANTARKNEILAKITKMDMALLTRMVHATYTTSLDEADFDPWLDWAYRVRFIDKRVRARELFERV